LYKYLAIDPSQKHIIRNSTTTTTTTTTTATIPTAKSKAKHSKRASYLPVIYSSISPTEQQQPQKQKVT
jgi:hypothetical protein